jgi:hypothetical protein
MTPAIAKSVVRILEANFGPWEKDKRSFWVHRVSNLEDGEAAYVTAGELVDGWTGPPPRYGDFRANYLRNRERVATARAERGLPSAENRHFGIPQWVYVWCWSRWRRDPRHEQPLPQMREPDTDEPLHDAISEEEYDELREEWVAAGAPRLDPLELVSEYQGEGHA